MNVINQKLLDMKIARLVRQNRMLRRQNFTLIRRVGQIVHNQKHYLNKRLKERGGYHKYVKEKERLRREICNFRQRFGKAHVTDISRLDGKPTHILLVGRDDARKLRRFLRADHRHDHRKLRVA